MEENLEERIRKSDYTVESLLKEARELSNKASSLHLEERKELPKFLGLWKEDELNNYLRNLKEAIDEPRIARSRKLLEDMGISSKGISKEILEKIEEIEEITRLSNELKEDIGEASNVLIEGGILVRWLKDGASKAKGNLQLVVNDMAGFKRLLSLENLSEDVKKEFLKTAFEDFTSISEAEDLNSKIFYLKEYGVMVDYLGGNLKEFSRKCETTYQSLKEVENKYKLPADKVKEWVKGKDLEEAYTYLDKKKEELSKEYNELKREWKELADILEEEALEPEGIPNLKKEIKEFEARCIKNLGKSGQILLKFFMGKADFPNKLSKEEIKNALKKLRPIIMKNFRDESNG